MSPERIRSAGKVIYDAGRHHGWWKPANVDYETFEQQDPIGFDEFNAIVSEALTAGDNSRNRSR